MKNSQGRLYVHSATYLKIKHSEKESRILSLSNEKPMANNFEKRSKISKKSSNLLNWAAKQ